MLIKVIIILFLMLFLCNLPIFNTREGLIPDMPSMPSMPSMPDKIKMPDKAKIPDKIKMPDKVKIPDKIKMPDKVKIPDKIGNVNYTDTISSIKNDTAAIKGLVSGQQKKAITKNTENIKQMETNIKKLEKRIVENEKEMKKTAKKLGKSMNKIHEAAGGNSKPPKITGLK